VLVAGDAQAFNINLIWNPLMGMLCHQVIQKTWYFATAMLPGHRPNLAKSVGWFSGRLSGNDDACRLCGNQSQCGQQLWLRQQLCDLAIKAATPLA
jgi:hypothetical protein